MSRAEKNSKSITPDTKVGELLKNFPDLEDTLANMSPAFGKLRNPVLRRTVGKVATLRQVANMGDIPLATLINNLRQAAGLAEVEVAPEEEHTADGTPDWFDQSKVAKTFDARTVLESGGQPMAPVMEHLVGMNPDQIYELITPFVPTPLIDLANKKGFKAWSKNEADDLVRTYFKKI
jgi:hypothetical protein